MNEKKSLTFDQIPTGRYAPWSKERGALIPGRSRMTL